MTKPVDGEVANDSNEPRREAGGMGAVGEIAAQASEIVRAQRLADEGEHVHDFVVLRRIVADRGEDETAVMLDEEIPCAVGIVVVEPGDPIAHVCVPVSWARTKPDRVYHGIATSRREDWRLLRR